TDKPYRITYQTKVSERELDGFTVRNSASFESHEKGSNHNVGQYVGLKSVGKIDYANKSIEWTIRINRDERQMKDVIITETRGAGITLMNDSITMTIGGKTYTDFTLEDGAANPFRLTNIGNTNEEIVVTYKTKYNPNDLRKDDNGELHADNTANVGWIP